MTDREERPPPAGRPGGGLFSLEGRRAPGLYFVGWLLSLGGVALIFVATLTQSDLWRLVLAVGGATVLGVGLAAAAGYQVVARSARERGRYRGPSPPLVFGVVLCFSTVASGIPLGGGLLDPSGAFGFLVGISSVAIAYLLGVWLFAVRSGALSWRYMGWPTARPGRLVRALRDIGIAIGVMLPVTFAMLLLGAIVATLLGTEAPQVLPVPGTSAEALAVAVGAALVAPIGEEIFFRGFALTAWLADLGPVAALARSSLFFALIHIVNISADDFAQGASQAVLQFVVILPLGAVLGVLFLRRGLVAAIAAHVTYNSLLLALVLARSLMPATP